jgi:hypothetical protein
MSTSSIRVPPDSTGARVSVVERYILDYDNQTVEFSVGDIVDGVSSGANGTITSIVTEGFAANSGRLYVASPTGTFIDNETLEVSGLSHAAADFTNEGFNSYNFQELIIVDPQNPAQRQRIDRFGATLNTFTDGSPVFGAFGSLTTGENQIIKEYTFPYHADTNSFWDQDSLGGAIAHHANTGTVVLSVPTTNNASISRTSNYYHHYSPGVGHLIEMTIQVGDTGKTGVVRRWGYYDDNDGIFFQLSGSTFSVVKRDSTSGSPVDTVVDQSDFNVDRVDGSDSIGFTLDLSKSNIFWIDLQWLGAGRVRTGVFDQAGTRLLMHTFEHANESNLPYMRTASLPLRVEQYNIATSASTSEIRWGCASVKHTSKVKMTGHRQSADTGGSLIRIQPSDGEYPVFALRPANNYGATSIDNRSLIRISSVILYNDTASISPCIFRLRVTDTLNLVNSSFTTVSNTTQIDLSANGFANVALAPQQLAGAIPTGTHHYIERSDEADTHTFELSLGADGNTRPTAVITAESLGSGNCDVAVFVNWESIE